jgi:hypothetical protein
MPRNINSAYRVHEVLAKAIKEGSHQEAMWQALAKAFSILNMSGQKVIFEVTRMLELFYGELEKTRQQMEASNFSSDLFAPTFKTIAERVTPGLMHNAWGGYANDLQGTLHSLRFCSEILPNEENLMSEEQLLYIREMLETLESKLVAGNLPIYVQEFIIEQIQIIRKALRDYIIVGGKAFKRALADGFISYNENEETIIQYQETEELKLLLDTWDQVSTAAKHTVKPKKLLAPGVKFQELDDKAAEG